MKALFTVVGLLVALAVLYGLAFVGVIPVQKWADKNPKLAKPLMAMHLARAKHKSALPASAVAPVPPDPQQQALRAGQKQLAADRAQLAKDREAWEAEKQQAATPPANGNASPANAASDTNAKLSAIYDTMSPDDLAKIFTKLSDPAVIQSLLPMDEKKAGKVLAALPPDRAARLARQMMASSPRPAAASPAAP